MWCCSPSKRGSPAYYLAANTGMRRGEVLGLRWRNVDLDARRLSVHQPVISVAYVLQIADVKTGTSRRTLDLDPPTVAVLRSWRKRQLEERLALVLGDQHNDHGLVFARRVGTPIHPDLSSKTFDRMVARSGLPDRLPARPARHASRGSHHLCRPPLRSRVTGRNHG